MPDIAFKPYTVEDRESCIRIFDANCPKFFSRNEREDYEHFLDSQPELYSVVLLENLVVGAFGIAYEGQFACRLDWILIEPQMQRQGIGSVIMRKVIARAQALEVHTLKIPTSHVATGFFTKFSAVKVSETINGWGPGMHRIDMEVKFHY
jgi:N-acetylglutamate synthase-like GNAT family acetyltransferase